MSNVKVHISVPGELLKNIDEIVGKRKRSELFVKAARDVVKRLKLKKSLEAAAGAWRYEDHPDLARKGASQWVRDIREQSEGRLKRKQD